MMAADVLMSQTQSWLSCAPTLSPASTLCRSMTRLKLELAARPANNQVEEST